MRQFVGRFGAGLAVVSLILGTGVGLGFEALGERAAGAAGPIVVNDPVDAAVVNNGAACLTSPEGDCTLRDAIAAFNAGTTDMTINLADPNTLTSTQAFYNVDSNLGELDIGAAAAQTLTINYTGPTPGNGVIQADKGTGTATDINIFDIGANATVNISSFTIQDGDNDANADLDGGAITNDGTLNLSDSTVIGNTTNASGGGIGQTSTDASLILTDDTISDNSATSDDGGGVYADAGTVTITGGTIGGVGATSPADKGNTSGDCGGGLALEGADGTISDVTIGGSNTTQANSSSDCGGGVYVSEGDPSFSGDTISNNSSGQGGGVYIEDGTNSFTNETITDNTATNGGGGVWIDDGANTFTDDTIGGNVASTEFALGGGVYIDDGTNSFTGTSISGNQAYAGGGVYIDDGSNTFNQSTISANTAPEGGGGLWVDTGDPDVVTAITQSTISGNAALGTIGEETYLGDGGGILASDCNLITLTNDTIASNTASIGGGGYDDTGCGTVEATKEAGQAGAAAAHRVTDHAQPALSSADVQFLFDTFSANSAGSGGGGNIQVDDASTVASAESIIAGGVSGGSPTTNCSFNFADGGAFTSAGYNLIDDSTCGTPGTGDIIGQGAQLGSLGENGGPTQTEEPGTGSPAIGAIPASVCSGTGVSTDQRGDARGAGLNGSCTIGAVEVAQATPPSYNPNGYRLVADEGGIFDFGLNFNGSLANNHLNAPIVGLANSPGPNGYVMVGADGGVFALGGANFYGSLGGQSIPSPIAAIAAPPTETGYWLVAKNGKIYNFGSVPALPALSLPPGAHIVGMASDTDGQGAWMTDQFGDVYAEGDALYEGGLGGVHLNAPIVGIAAAAAGQGYVLVASDGGVFNYKMGFYGSVPGSLKAGQSLVAPIVGIAVTHSGNGYWEVGADGGVFNYGDAPFLGSIYTAIPGKKLNGPIVGIQHLGSAPPA